MEDQDCQQFSCLICAILLKWRVRIVIWTTLFFMLWFQDKSLIYFFFCFMSLYVYIFFLRKPTLLHSSLCLSCRSPFNAISMEKVINLDHNIGKLVICKLHFSLVWYRKVSCRNYICDEGCYFLLELYPKVIVDCKKVLGNIAEIILLTYNCITDSLRLLQHVETIQVPSSWESLHSTTWEEISWEEKQFKVREFLRV